MMYTIEDVAERCHIIRVQDVLVPQNLSPEMRAHFIALHVDANPPPFSLSNGLGELFVSDDGTRWRRLQTPGGASIQHLPRSHPSNAESFCLTLGSREFDYIAGGGICSHADSGTSVVIQGESGLGKSVFANQLLVNAVARSKAAAILYSFNSSADHITAMYSHFGWQPPLNRVAWESNAGAKVSKPITVVDACGVAELTFEKVMRRIPVDIGNLRERFPDRTPLIVLDPLDALQLSPENTDMLRIRLRQLYTRAVDLGAILIVLQQSASGYAHLSEELSDVVVTLRKEPARRKGGRRQLTTTMEIVKTRGQSSFRGPHEYEIVRGVGIAVWPSLPSVIEGFALSRRSSEPQRAALFGLPPLDDLLGAESESGLQFGQCILLHGPPGCLKLELAAQFLHHGILSQNEGRAVFVNYRLPEATLHTLKLYREIADRVDFIDISAESPSKTMALIRRKVEQDGHSQVRRIVCWGIGLLDSTQTNQEILDLLRVLTIYCRRQQISGILVNWRKTKAYRAADDRVASTIHVDRESRLVRLKRNNYRSVDTVIGTLKVTDGELAIIPGLRKAG